MVFTFWLLRNFYNLVEEIDIFEVNNMRLESYISTFIWVALYDFVIHIYKLAVMVNTL